VRFCGSAPFGFSGAIDVPERPHTHDALADAIEPAEIFIRLW
jgi:hypothetical protein